MMGRVNPASAAFADWCRERRLALRETQAEFADAIGRSRSWLAQLERGEHRPRAEDCARIAAHVEVPYRSVLVQAGYSADDIASLTGSMAPSFSAIEFEAAVAKAVRLAALELGIPLTNGVTLDVPKALAQAKAGHAPTGAASHPVRVRKPRVAPHLSRT